MDEITLIQARTNINLMIEQLDQWNDKKPNDRLMKWKELLIESLLTNSELENEFKIARQRNSELEMKLLNLDKENKDLISQNEKLAQGL